jgi:hypothetical protein
MLISSSMSIDAIFHVEQLKFKLNLAMKQIDP